MAGGNLERGEVVAGSYEIYRRIGAGAHGVVYAAYNRETGEPYALKTLSPSTSLRTVSLSNREDEPAAANLQEAFRNEAELWIKLGDHPCILRAHELLESTGQLFLAVDYLVSDDHGRLTLKDHLYISPGPLPLEQALRWAVEFCFGMEYANDRALRCHGDIKPSNILITEDGNAKISDFGLALPADSEAATTRAAAGYAAPEVLRKGAAGVRSDIYSFGLVLWQMAKGSIKPPFAPPIERDVPRYLKALYKLQMSGRVPPVESPLRPIIERCLAPGPADRYADFTQFRAELARLLRQQTGKTAEPQPDDESTAAFWNRKGSALRAVRRLDEAIACFDEALKKDPRYAHALSNKGRALAQNDQLPEAVACYDTAIQIDPDNAGTWNEKGVALRRLGRTEEAVTCLERALSIDPRYAYAWNNKASALHLLSRFEEAVGCCDKALEFEPRYAQAWFNKGVVLADLGRHEDAVTAYEEALSIDPGLSAAWNNKGNSLRALDRLDEALACYAEAIKVTPDYAAAWNNKGTVLMKFARFEEAVDCFEKSSQADPEDVAPLFNRAMAEEKLGRREAARELYADFIAQAPAEYASQISIARRRLHKLT